MRDYLPAAERQVLQYLGARALESQVRSPFVARMRTDHQSARAWPKRTRPVPTAVAAEVLMDPAEAVASVVAADPVPAEQAMPAARIKQTTARVLASNPASSCLNLLRLLSLELYSGR